MERVPGKTDPLRTTGIDPAILEYYAAWDEAARLERSPFWLERARTEELLLRYLPPAPARILDVGGGPGAYACWAAELGYEVTLIDAVPRHVEQARRVFEAHPDRDRLHAELGDARALAVPDGSQDAVLLLGPLYHLQEYDDRVRALREAARVLRSGGILCAAAISRFASFLSGLLTGSEDDPTFAAIVDEDLRTGRHLNPTDRVDWFTTAYFHLPDDLTEEVMDADLELLALVGIEGPAWMLADLDARWADPERRQRLLARLRAVESAPALLGVSPHLMAVARQHR